MYSRQVFTVQDFSKSIANPTDKELRVFAYPGSDGTGKVHMCFTDKNDNYTLFEIDSKTWSVIRRLTVEPSNTDELINEYAAMMQAVYCSGSAGDHTFTGLMSEFARKLLGKD